MADYCFIIAPQNLHWVLDRIAHEIGKRCQGTVEYCYELTNIPQAKHYFVTHYSLLPQVLMKVNPANSKITCFFTHESVPVESLKPAMNLCHAVVCENGVEYNRLLAYGINPDILSFVVECSDNFMFPPHARTGKGHVLVSSACYPRKNPKLLFDVAKLLNRKILLVGKDWNEAELPSNISYFDRIPYEAYPALYKQCDVFLSCSSLEGGGPASLIEAMHSNMVPVVSDTGNAREYIIDGYNGLIFPTNASADKVVNLIEEAYLLKPQDAIPYNDIWQTVRHYTWDSYANQMISLMTGVNEYQDIVL